MISEEDKMMNFLIQLLIYFQWTVLTRPALTTAFAWTGPAFARKAGKEVIALKWMKRRASACQTVQATDTSIWKCSSVFARTTGSEMTAHRDFVIWTAEILEGT